MLHAPALSAHLLYADTAPFVNSPVSSSAAVMNAAAVPASPLLASLLDGSSLTIYLRGVVSALGCPRKWGDVVAALVSHIGRHSNRTWAGVDRLAAESSTSPSTVKRCTKWLRDTLGLAVVSGDELAAGPGPHRYDGAKRGRQDTNTYELSPLALLLPPAFVAAIRAALAGMPRAVAVVPPLDDLASFPDPFTDQAPLVESPAAAQDLAASAVGVRGAAPSQDVSAADTFLPSPSCNVSIESAPAEKTPARKAGAGAFLGSKLSRIVEGGHGPGYLALRALGVWSAAASKICETRGDAWALKLAAYVRWAPDVKNRASYARTTAATWEGWPDWFTARWDREQAAASRAESCQSSVRVALDNAPNTHAQEPAPAVADPLLGLDPERRAVVEAAALARLPVPLRRLATPGGPARALLLENVRVILSESGESPVNGY